MTLLLQGAGIQALTVAPSGPVPLLDLEADTLVLSDGDPVSTWADQGDSHDFTQTGATRPTRQTVSSYPTVRFAGNADQEQYLTDGDFANNLDNFTVVCVAGQHPSIFEPFAGNFLLIGKYDFNATNAYWIFSIGADNAIQYDVADDLGNELTWATSADAIGAGMYVLSINVTSRSAAQLYINGAAVGTLAYNGGTPTDFSNAAAVRTGNDSVFDSFPGRGSVSAIRIYTPALSSTDRAAKEAELADRYGITL